MFAKALGAEVYAFSHSRSKEKDAKQLGADHYIYTSEKGFQEPLSMSLDLIVSTRDSSDDFPLDEYLSSVLRLCRTFRFPS